MNITSTRFATHAHTWLLIAALTALLVGIGALIGGAFLAPDQVKGVLAHEFAHIENRDILVSSIPATVAGAIAAIANIVQWSLFFGSDDEDAGPLGWIGLLATIILAPIAASAAPARRLAPA